MLLSIVIGTIVAAIMGQADFSNVADAAWFGGPQIFRFGAPKFAAAAIITMCIVMLVTFTESTADMLAVGEMVDKDLTPNDLARGLATDALSGVHRLVHQLLPGHGVRGERRPGRPDRDPQPLGGHHLRRRSC